MKADLLDLRLDARNLQLCDMLSQAANFLGLMNLARDLC